MLGSLFRSGNQIKSEMNALNEPAKLAEAFSPGRAKRRPGFDVQEKS
jgi:hypothetical protein